MVVFWFGSDRPGQPEKGLFLKIGHPFVNGVKGKRSKWRGPLILRSTCIQTCNQADYGELMDGSLQKGHFMLIPIRPCRHFTPDFVSLLSTLLELTVDSRLVGMSTPLWGSMLILRGSQDASGRPECIRAGSSGKRPCRVAGLSHVLTTAPW